MKPKSLPYPLKGHFSFVKNEIKKQYKNNVVLLSSEDEWYENVIGKSDSYFGYLYSEDFIYSDLKAIVEYVKSKLTLSDIRHVKEKYGELHYYHIAMEYVIVPLYQRAYNKAVKELQNAC